MFKISEDTEMRAHRGQYFNIIKKKILQQIRQMVKFAHIDNLFQKKLGVGLPPLHSWTGVSGNQRYSPEDD